MIITTASNSILKKCSHCTTIAVVKESYAFGIVLTCLVCGHENYLTENETPYSPPLGENSNSGTRAYTINNSKTRTKNKLPDQMQTTFFKIYEGERKGNWENTDWSNDAPNQYSVAITCHPSGRNKWSIWNAEIKPDIS